MSATGRSLSAETGHERHADDFYATPAWATRAILPEVAVASVLDPCCGDGAILDVAARAGQAQTSGVELDESRALSARAKGHSVRCVDALGSAQWPKATAIVTNPPYRLAAEFVTRALFETGGAIDCAFLLRLNWLASQKRFEFHRSHPSDVFVLSRRPSFMGGKTDATEYAWFVWGPGRGGRWSILDLGRVSP